MSILSALWSVGRAYSPSAAADARARRERRSERFGAFTPSLKPHAWHRRPRTDAEAQRLYNHIRTMAFYLDAAPALADLGLPFRAGIDDIVSLVPFWGDIVSGFIQLYAVWMCFLFGAPRAVCGWMLLNVIVDIVVGIVPLIGDVLDNLWKANLRNLALLETWLLSGEPPANRYHILLMPDTATYLPSPKKSGRGRWNAWFGPTDTPVEDERSRERATGQVKRTRRMARDEGEYAFGAKAKARARARGTHPVDEPDVMPDPLD